jgi:hypothetical protein
MKKNKMFIFVTLVAALFLAFYATSSAAGIVVGVDSPDSWWPSPWGADDEVGAGNLLTPQVVKKASNLVTQGRVYELGREYGPDMPLSGGRTFQLRIVGSPTGGPFGANMNVYHDDFVVADLGQVGTQFDGFGHIGIQQGPDGDKSQMRYYNGFTELDLYSRSGLQRLGVENVPPIFTTGFLVDIAGLKGRMLQGGEEISLQDVRDALRRQNINENQIEPGSAILFNTGYGSLWGVDNDSYGNSSPGIGLEVAEWLVEKQVVVAGADTFALEVVPNPDPSLAFPVHAVLLVRNGIYLQENLDLSELVAEGVDKFAYIYVRVPITGATGSPGSPIAVK